MIAWELRESPGSPLVNVNVKGRRESTQGGHVNVRGRRDLTEGSHICGDRGMT